MVQYFYMGLSGVSFVMALVFTIIAAVRGSTKKYALPLALGWGGSFLLLSLELIMPELVGWQGWLTAGIGKGLLFASIVMWVKKESIEDEENKILLENKKNQSKYDDIKNLTEKQLGFLTAKENAKEEQSRCQRSLRDNRY